jgi:hypothetical protein
MNAIAYLGQSREEVSVRHGDLIVHDDPSEIQVRGTSAYLIDPAGAFEFVLDEAGRVDTVFVTAPSALLDGVIDHHSDRPAVVARFGDPSVSGPEVVDPSLGRLGAWDRFDLSECSVLCQYKTASEWIERIVVMSPAAADRFGIR